MRKLTKIINKDSNYFNKRYELINPLYENYDDFEMDEYKRFRTESHNDRKKIK